MNKRKQYLIPILVLAGVLTLTIGFAAFSSNLVIEPGASVTPNASSFKVVFSKSESGEETGTLTPTTGTGATATIDNTSNEKPTISNLSANFVSPGEETTYEFYAYNKGEYKAYLTNIAFNNVSGTELTKTCVAATGTSQDLVDQACEGISMHIDIDGLLADTTMDTSGHSIDKTKAHKVVITIKYDQNAARADGNFTVTFGNIELTYKSIEGTGSSTGGLSGGSGSSSTNVALGGTYTLKNGQSSTVLFNTDTINQEVINKISDNNGQYTYGYKAILKDGSEWLVYSAYNEDKLILFSANGYILEGENAFEMDTTGNGTAITETDSSALSTLISDSLNQIKTKLATNLNIDSQQINLSALTFMYDMPFNGTPLIYEGGNYVCYDSQCYLYTELSIDKSYIDYIVTPNTVTITDNIVFPEEVDLTKIIENDSELIYIMNSYFDSESKLLFKLSTGESLNAVESDGFYTSAMDLLGYSYTCTSNTCSVDNIEEVDENVKVAFENYFKQWDYSFSFESFPDGLPEWEIKLLKISK